MKRHEFDALVKSIKQAGKIRRGEMTGGRIIASHPFGYRSVSITDLRRKTSRVLDVIKDSMEPLFITRHGKVVAVLLSIKAYMKLESERR